MKEFRSGEVSAFLKDVASCGLERRFHRREKEKFFAFISEKFRGFNVSILKLGPSRNIVIGDIDAADVLLSAHYDTAKNAVLNLKMYYDGAKRNNFKRLPLFMLSGILSLRANNHSMNDNTSGIAAVYDLLLRGCKTAAILFDNEERGYCGSAALMRKRKDLRDKLFINLDCIGAGDRIAVIYNDEAAEAAKKLCGYFSAEVTCDKLSQSRYSSDGDDLKRAVTVAAFKRDASGKRYIDDIHTKHDTRVSMENIRCVTDAVAAFLKAEQEIDR